MRPLLALALACCACKGTTTASREAWDKAITRPGDSGQKLTFGGGGRTPRGSGERDAWQALAQFATDAGELLAGGSTTVTLPRLADQLCVEIPEALAQDPKLDAVRCELKTPLAALGQDFQLELGSASTIGLAARELSDQASAELVRQALQQLKGACRATWTPVPRRADNALEEFHTCPTATGAMLVVGRFPSDLGSGQWQFSLAVLGPG